MTRFLKAAAVAALVAPAAAADATSVSVAYFAPDTPGLVRVDVTLDGKPIEVAWTKAVDGLFAHLDRNGDGVLDEAERAVMGVRVPRGRRPVVDPAGGDGVASDLGRLTFDKAVEKVDRAAFTDALKAAGLGPVNVQFQAPADNSAALTTALFRHLDADGDGKLSPAELAAARERLEVLDVNEDEWLTAPELLARGTANVRQPLTRPRTPDPTPTNPNDLLVLNTSTVKAVKQLLTARGKTKTNALGRTEMGMTKAGFAKFDRDSNGSLDTDELTGWLAEKPTLTLTLALQSDAAKSAVTPLGVTTVAGSRFEVARPAGTSANEWTALESQLKVAFKSAAKDGVVAKDKLTNQPALAAAFPMVDRNGDDKIDEKELTAALTALAPLAVCRADVTIVDLGRGLFELVDTNADGQLSQRELAAGPAVLKEYLAADGLTKALVPRSFPVHPLANGIRPLGTAAATREAFDASELMAASRRTTPATSGPAWFAKTDRNADGDVSRKEFLGPLELFQKLDADGDGLISADEAKAAKE